MLRSIAPANCGPLSARERWKLSLEREAVSSPGEKREY